MTDKKMDSAISGKCMLRYFLFFLFALISGCSSLFPKVVYGPTDEKAYHHIGSDLFGAYEPYLKADQKLSYHPPRNIGEAYGLSKDEIADNGLIYQSYLRLLNSIENRMYEYVTKDPKTGEKKLKVMLFFHGGLNYPGDNDDRLDQHLSAMLDNNGNDGYFPIFVSWRSGLFVSEGDRYTRVRGGEYTPGSLGVVRGFLFYLPSDVLTGIAKMPETAWDRTANFFGSRAARKNGIDRDRGTASNVEYASKNVLLWESGIKSSWFDDFGHDVKQVIPGVAKVVTTPILQGLATPAWGMMIRRSQDLMIMEADVLKRQESYCGNQCDYNRGNGVVSILAKKLEQMNSVLQKQGIKMEIMVVGHSMGAIVANDLVFAYPDLPYKTIIHMASADSMRNWIDKTAVVLREKKSEGKPVEFYNLVLHPTDEEREDKSFGFAVQGSLLVWLDDMFAVPDNVLDRRSGRWVNARNLMSIYEDIGDAHLKVFPLNKPAVPHVHGDFGKFQFWKKEFYWHETSNKALAQP
jgi:hypothetical protein